MPRNLDVAALRTLMVVAESGSMTAAASRLHITQGAVSQQIKRLEESFGRVILERGRAGVRLTEEGRRLLGKAGRLVALNDEIMAELHPPEVSGQVRLGAPFDLVGTHLPPILQRYVADYPHVDISLVSSSSPDLSAMLAAGKIDLALLEEPLAKARGERLASEPLLWVGSLASNVHAKRPLPVCLVSETCSFRPAVFAALEAQGIEWRVVFDNASIESTNAVVRAGLAVTACLGSTIASDLDLLGEHVDLPLLPAYAISLYLGDSTSSPACLALAAAIRQGYAAH